MTTLSQTARWATSTVASTSKQPVVKRLEANILFVNLHKMPSRGDLVLELNIYDHSGIARAANIKSDSLLMGVVGDRYRETSTLAGTREALVS